MACLDYVKLLGFDPEIQTEDYTIGYLLPALKLVQLVVELVALTSCRRGYRLT